MLGGERTVGLVSELDPQPTISQTFEAAKSKATVEAKLLAGYIFPGLTTDEQKKKSAAQLSAINELLSDPRQGYGQQATNAVGGIIGGIIPTLPFALAGGAVGAGVAGAIGFGARELALDIGGETALTSYLSTQVPLSSLAEGAASHYLPRFSAGKIAAGFAEGYTGYKGMIIPEHFAEYYDAVNNTLDKSHAIEDWASDNYGFLLGAVPMAAGYIAFKGVRGVIAHRTAIADSKALDAELTRLLRDHEEVLKENQVKAGEHAEKVAKVSELQDHLQQAEDEGHITPEMHEWYLDYLENPNDMGKVHEGGLKVLQALQIPYDRVTGRVWNEVLSRDGIKNLQSAMFDQAITNFSEEENQLLSSFIVHNQLDGYIAMMRENPNMLEAIQGLTHNLGARIEANSNALMAFEKALTRELPKGLMKRELFSQKNIYEHLKKIGVHDTQHVPYYVPKSIRDKLKIVKQIKLIEAQRSKKYQRLYKEGRHIFLKEQLKENTLLNPADELMHLKEQLLPEGKLAYDYNKQDAFHRLEDLSQVWPPAKVLLDRVQMEAMNAKQKGLNDILKKFTEMVDTNASRIANPDSVKRYLHSRIERAVPVAREFEQSRINVEANPREVIRDAELNTPEQMFDEAAKERVQKSEFEAAKVQYEESEKKYKQFSENEKALDELIKCALGE